MPRTPSADVGREAVDLLVRAFHHLFPAWEIESAGKGRRTDLLIRAGDQQLLVEVKAVSGRAEPARIATQLPTWEAQLDASRAEGREVVGVLVAGAVPDATRAQLAAEGWGWLDRRGELRVTSSRVAIDARVPLEPMPAAPAPEPVRGRAGITLAAALLMTPTEPPGVREVARRGGLSPSSVSDAMKALREASLVYSDGRPLVPELFWVLADAWAPELVFVARAPSDNDDAILQLRAGVGTGWVVAGTLAAIELGAPLVATADYPPDFYAPAATTPTQVVARLGTVPAAERAATVRYAPTELVVREPGTAHAHAAGLSWPTAHPLFIALDLAGDKARGVETLESWHPESFERVW